jgi:hypothetical protein
MSGTIIKGSISSIPTELLKEKRRNEYMWEELEIGDYKVFDTSEDFNKVRSSYTNFSKPNKHRGALTFRSRVIATGGPNGDQKVLEVYRLPNPVDNTASVNAVGTSNLASAEVQETEITSTATETVSEIPAEINPPNFKANKRK